MKECVNIEELKEMVLELANANALVLPADLAATIDSRDVECEEFRYEEHFTFTETVSPTDGRRNPHVFVGQYITVTRKDDGTLRPNFRPMPAGRGFELEKYALGVYSELLWALEGLVERSEK